MFAEEINIRDPFVLEENGRYYMYGTRAAGFGICTGGFDVYVSDDLREWSAPVGCFDSARYGMNRQANWAPEVHKYGGAYYMFATFTQENGLRGTYILKADDPMGPFAPHSDGAVTPDGWECLDGTFYVEDGAPYIVFCHEHTQITDGTICFQRLRGDLSAAVGEPVTIFSGSSPYYVGKKPDGEHYVTDGPFMFRTSSGALLMLWSTILDGKYAECLVRFGESIRRQPEHLPPILDSDGGHGMIFNGPDGLYFTYHSPNSSLNERPHFVRILDEGDTISIAG